MKKNLLALSLLLAGMSAVAQTPRLSLFEEFTGETCPPCAAANPALNTLLASPTNTPKVVAIKWQVPIPSAPTKTWSLYQTNKTEIDWRYRSTANGGYGYTAQYTPTNSITNGINSAPTCLIDGQHQWVFGASSDHPNSTNNGVIATAQSFTSAFSITMTRAWDPTYSSINLTVNIVASAPFTAVGPLVFRTVMVERHIHFPTQPGTNGEKDFDDVAIASFPTHLTPIAMASTWVLNQAQTFTMNCPIPAYARDKSEIAFVGFIQDDGNRKVAQAGRADSQTLANDAKAVTASVPAIVCASAITPTISISNHGSNNITGLTVVPMIDQVASANYVWTGNLAVGATTVITLPSISGITPGSHVFSYDITNVSGTDYNQLNNTKSTKFVIEAAPAASPVVEGFVNVTFPPTNWVAYDPADGATFFRTAATGGFGLSPESTKLDLYGSSALTAVADGAVNNLILPPVDFTLTSGVLKFDVAYAQWNTSLDKLEVQISSNCGQTWTTVYNKSGSTLSTTGASVSAAFTPGSTQWRTETVALNNMQLGNTLVRFQVVSDYGNNIYIDNVNLKQCAVQTISVTAPKLSICKGNSVILTATGATSYSWNTGATTATIAVSPTAVTTPYTAFSADANACPGSQGGITISVSQCTGIDQITQSNFAHSVFPNPNNGEFTLIAELTTETMMNVYNALGQKVYEQKLSSNQNAIKTNLPKGLYHYELVQSDKSIATGKLVIE